MISMDQRIGVRPRAAAVALDNMLMGALAIVLAIVAAGFFGSIGSLMGGGPGDPAGAARGGQVGAATGFSLVFLAFPVVAVLYSLIEGLYGWSPAKRIMGFQIACADATPASRRRLMTRYLVKDSPFLLSVLAATTGLTLLSSIGSVIWFVVGIGCALALLEERQALHDYIAGTAVFRADELREEAARALVPARSEDVERIQCPKCGQRQTEVGTHIGWYCTICGWRESRGEATVAGKGPKREEAAR